MSGYIGTQPVPQATQTRDVFTATSGQTSFATSGYTPNFLDVWLNGVKLVNGDDFTATNGSDVVLTSGAAAGDTVEVLSYSTYEVNAQTYTGGLTVNNDAATVLTVDRATSDGTIIDVQKDGITVGSIGTSGGAADFTIVSNRTYLDLFTNGNANGLTYRDDATEKAFRPWNSKDAQINLGNGVSRFKNLYLSGGVYLGGTGSANLLDDYEEGTWTPTVSSGTVSAAYASYVKIGKFVTLRAFLTGFSDRTSATGLTVSGLPFTTSGYIHGASTMHRYIAAGNGGDHLTVYANSASTGFTFYSCVQGGQYTPTVHSNLVSSSSAIFVTISYMTDA